MSGYELISQIDKFLEIIIIESFLHRTQVLMKKPIHTKDHYALQDIMNTVSRK